MTPYEHGAAAFKKGKPRIPALDQAFLREHCNGPVGTGARALDEWLRGWDAANSKKRPTPRK